jgi:hypothetical protein
MLENKYYSEQERSYSVSENFFDIDNQLKALVEEYRSDIQRVIVAFRNNNDYILSDYFGESTKLFKVQLGRFFDDPSANQILIPESTQNGADYIGETYNIEGEEFEIIGISSIGAYEIQYQSLRVKERIEQVTIVTIEDLKKGSLEALLDGMRRIFQTKQIDMPAPPLTDEMTPDYFIIFGIILLGMLNISYIYISIIEKRRRQQAVFYILGCNRPKLIGLYLLEIFTITTLSFSLCAVFSKFVLFHIFNALDEFYYHAINLEQYFFLYIIYISPMLVILLLQFIRFFDKTPLELKRK